MLITATERAEWLRCEMDLRARGFAKEADVLCDAGARTWVDVGTFDHAAGIYREWLISNTVGGLSAPATVAA